MYFNQEGTCHKKKIKVIGSYFSLLLIYCLNFSVMFVIRILYRNNKKMAGWR